VIRPGTWDRGETVMADFRKAKAGGPERRRPWPILVKKIESPARPVTPEDVWNAAMRAGADPARLALSLSHVLGEVTYDAMRAGREDEPALVRYTLTTGEAVEYDAGFHNPFKGWRDPPPPSDRPDATS
jgi:hypothetical protein